MAFAPRGFRSFAMAIPLWLREKLFQKSLLQRELARLGDGPFDADARLLFAEHHQSHAASAFFASPFERAAVLTMAGVGEWATTSVGVGRGNRLGMIKEIHFPCGIGSWGGRRPRMGDYVTGTGATSGAGAAGGRSC